MANLTGENFYKYVDNQIKVRQEKLGGKVKDTNQILWQNSKTPWIKLCSSIDIHNDTNIKDNHEAEDRLKKLGLDINLYKGADLAKAFILFNGTTNHIWRSQNQTNGFKTGLAQNSNSFKLNDAVYGFGGLEFGFRPMPGITSIDIKSKNRGSLREATIQLKAFTKQQFQIIDALYMRLGYTILLEWGNSSYFDNDGNYISNPIHSLADEFLNYDAPTTLPKGKTEAERFTQLNAKQRDDLYKFAGKFEGAIKFTDKWISLNYGQGKILNLIEQKRKESFGNYDAMYGKISNFNWDFNSDGVYNITIKVVSIGDVIESLTMNKTDPIASDPVSNTADATKEISVETERNKHNIGRYLYKLSQLEDIGNAKPTTNIIDSFSVINEATPEDKKKIEDKKIELQKEEDIRLENIGLGGPKI